MTLSHKYFKRNPLLCHNILWGSCLGWVMLALHIFSTCVSKSWDTWYNVRQNINIKGIKIGKEKYCLQQYADDTEEIWIGSIIRHVIMTLTSDYTMIRSCRYTLLTINILWSWTYSSDLGYRIVRLCIGRISVNVLLRCNTGNWGNESLLQEKTKTHMK